MQPVLAVIDIDIEGGQDELAREGLLEHLAAHEGRDIAPLWLNLLRERADLRVVCLVRDTARFDDFLVDVIRTVPGVRGTSAHLSFDGVVRSEAILDISLQNALWDRRACATVFAKLQPGSDREAFTTLVNLPRHQEVSVVWVVKVFHSSESDLMILLLGERTASLTGYVMSWIRTVPGVTDTQVSSVMDWQVLGDTEDFLALAERYPEPPDP
jgi:DNA-binding Lrp family transcriptional regulator